MAVEIDGSEFVRPIFIPEALKEAHADGNEWFIHAELYAILTLGVLDRWVSRRKLAKLICELARRDLVVRRSIELPESICYENVLDIITNPFYLDEAFEYDRGRVRLSDFGEIVFNEYMNMLPPERFFELKREILEMWKGGGVE
ncbi:hypothetical protein [Thermococcus henrietii]|uniref:hypothetical protein n=1 Tax=Thermococcus henrietii TaxID=2016361 RepID=UPI0011AB48C3|nr:hypothetical protein [Thermococcus henrietii]